MGPQGIRYYDRYNATRGKGIKGTHKGIGWCCVVRRRLRVDGRCTTQRTRELQGHSTPQQPGQSTPPQTAQHTACGLESTCSHHGCTCRSIRNDLDINVVAGAGHDVKVFKVVDINAPGRRNQSPSQKPIESLSQLKESGRGSTSSRGPGSG